MNPKKKNQKYVANFFFFFGTYTEVAIHIRTHKEGGGKAMFLLEVTVSWNRLFHKPTLKGAQLMSSALEH